jgi:hypothetical protein
MATATLPRPATAAPGPGEIKLFSHSVIFYWWPVWLVGYLMAFLTYLDGGRMAVVPPGTEARRDWRVEVAPGRLEAREGLILPPSADGRQTHLLPSDGSVPLGEPLPPPEAPQVRVAGNPFLGTWFLLTLLAVFISANVPLRGLWEWIGVLVIALVVLVLFLYGWWRNVLDWFYLLHIQINLAGYVFLATWLFAIWVVTVFYFDTRTYVVISAGQVRVRQAIGQGEKIYDATLLALHLQPNILFRHRVLGLFGAGDLVVRTGGPQAETFEWPNVLFVRSRLRQIEHLLQSREVLPEAFRPGA